MNKNVFFIMLIIGILHLSSCSLFTSPEAEAKKSYNLFISSLTERKYEDVWNCLSYESQTQYENFIYKPFVNRLKIIPQEQRKQNFPNTDVSIEALAAMQPKDYFVFQMEETDLNKDMVRCFSPERTIESVTVNGSEAVLKMSETSDRSISSEIPMRLEDGVWRIVLFPPGDIKH